MSALYCDINWEQNIVGEPQNQLENLALVLWII